MSFITYSCQLSSLALKFNQSYGKANQLRKNIYAVYFDENRRTTSTPHLSYQKISIKKNNFWHTFGKYKNIDGWFFCPKVYILLLNDYQQENLKA